MDGRPKLGKEKEGKHTSSYSVCWLELWHRINKQHRMPIFNPLDHSDCRPIQRHWIHLLEFPSWCDNSDGVCPIHFVPLSSSSSNNNCFYVTSKNNNDENKEKLLFLCTLFLNRRLVLHVHAYNSHMTDSMDMCSKSDPRERLTVNPTELIAWPKNKGGSSIKWAPQVRDRLTDRDHSSTNHVKLACAFQPTNGLKLVWSPDCVISLCGPTVTLWEVVYSYACGCMRSPQKSISD